MAEVDVSIPHEEEHSAEILSGEETTTTVPEAASEAETETETEKEHPTKEAINGAKKENHPPKRSIPPKRLGPSSSTVSKPTASTSSRTTTGGLSKPPTRAPLGATVRKPASSATAPTSSSTGHRSQSSVGGSGDEKKKPLASAARRTSLAPSGAHHSPAKTETLAEKRASGASTITRKPATSISSSSPKPVAKPSSSTAAARTTGTTNTTASRSAPISKSTSSGAVADAKKRLSTISGSPSAAKPTARGTGHSSASTSTKEVDELKAKLEDSETRVAELQKEIVSSQEKLLELGKQVEVEAQRVSEAESNIKTEHGLMIEKLHAKHREDVEELKIRLAEAETARAAAQESSSKAIEEAKEAAASQGASDLAEALEKLKAEHMSELETLKAEHSLAFDASKKEHVSTLEALKAELAAAKDAHSSTTASISEREAEITTLRSQILEENEKIDGLKKEHEAIIADLKTTLAVEHESSLSALKAAHLAELSKGNIEVSSTFEKQIADLRQKHDSVTNDLQKKLEQAAAAQATLEAAHKEKYETHKTESASAVSRLEEQLSALKTRSVADSDSLAKSIQETQKFKAESEAVQKQLVSAREELTAVSKELEALRIKAIADEKALASAQAEVEAAKQEVVSLQRMMDTFDADSKSKEELYQNLKKDLNSTVDSLEAKTSEISALHDKHRKELETITNDYEKEIEALQGNSGIKAEYETLQKQHADLTKSLDDITAAHAEEVESLKAKQSEMTKSQNDAAEAHAKELKSLRVSHEGLSKSHTDAVSNHAKQLEQLKQERAATIVDLDNQKSIHQKTIEDLKEAHAQSLDDAHDRAITAGHAAHSSELEQLQASHTDAMAVLKEQFKESQGNAVSLEQKLKTTEEALQAEILKTKELLGKSQSEVEDLKQDLAHEKMAKASAQADLETALNKKPDTSEVDTLRKELQALKDSHQAALMTAQQESAKSTEENIATKTALEKAQAELNRQKAEAMSDYKDMHESLTQLVEEANKKASDAEARLKEAEANLKVKDAELAEAKTKSAPLASPRTPTISKPEGLASSRFAQETEKASPTLKSEAAEGEPDSSSAALASLARARVTIQQLDQMNDDLAQENMRSLESITDIPASGVTV